MNDTVDQATQGHVPDTAQVWVQRESDAPLELIEAPLPAPSRHQVTVQIHATGLCQSQVFWMHRAQNHPELHGHEGFAEVVAVGENVSGLSPGDPVVMTWIPRQAADGRAPSASSVRDGAWTGHSHNVHTWATHAVVDELYLLKLPEEVASPAAAIIGCAVPTGAGAVRNSAAMPQGANVAVIGLGGVGLSAVAAARSEGADHVVAVDISDDKLEFAKRFGATQVLNSSVTSLSELSRRFTGIHGSTGFDVVIDCVGAPQTVAEAIRAAAPGGIGSHRGGTVVLVGAPKGPLEIDGQDLLMSEKSLIGCRGGGLAPQEDFPVYVDWMRDGRLPLEEMVTDTYTFDQLPRAVEDLAGGRIRGRALVSMVSGA